MENPSPPALSLASAWGFEPHWAACSRCGWSYLLPIESQPKLCPHCFAAPLSTVGPPPDDPGEVAALLRPPELVLPFTLTEAGLAGAIQEFAQGIPFPPSDLNPASLTARIERFFLPLWLVDAEVQATWEMEAGYDYQVVSHQDRFDDQRGGWISHEVKEDRVRWEHRLGRLARGYTNLPAPALEAEPQIQRSLGEYALREALPYNRDISGRAPVRLPDRSPQDAWLTAQPAFQAAAAEECRRAAGAGHERDFRWSPQFDNQNWTLLLRPIITTYYVNDDGVPQPVWVHGQSGKTSGARRSSARRARRTALIILSAALAVFLIGLLLSAASMLYPPLLAVGGAGIVLGVLIALGAALPVVTSWQFNRSQADRVSLDSS